MPIIQPVWHSFSLSIADEYAMIDESPAEFRHHHNQRPANFYDQNVGHAGDSQLNRFDANTIHFVRSVSLEIVSCATLSCVRMGIKSVHLAGYNKD